MKKKTWIFLVIFFLLLTLFLTIWAIRTQRLETRKKAEEKETTVISEWAPIQLAKFNAGLNQEIAELNIETIELINKKWLSKEENKQLNTLKRSTEAKQIALTEYSLMDENKDGKIDYDEFNAKTVDVSEKIYQRRHSKIENKSDGFYRVSQSSVSTTNTLKVIIEAGIYEGLLDSLEQYKADVEAEYEYEVEFYLCNGCTKEEIKAALQAEGTVGAVLIGDLPSAWFKIENCFHQVRHPVRQIASMMAHKSWGFMEDIIEDQMEVQSKLADSQIRLTDAQASLLELQADSIRRDGMKINVTIQGDTTGWLTGLMDSLINEIFIKAESEGFQCFGV